MTDPEFEQEPPSKTARKKAMAALQTLGERLLTLSSAQLASIALPESLRDALREAKRINSREGLRRHQQYIGKLMRDVDPAPITAALEIFDGVSSAEIARHHRLERLRELFIADESVLAELLELCPGIDVQQLRQLRRNVLKEREQNKPPKHFRALYQLLKQGTASRPSVPPHSAAETPE